MLNAEKYRKEILNNYSKGFSIIDDHIDDCESIACESCLFSNSKNDDGYLTCINRKVRWLLSEYKEPVKLIRVEHEILRYLYKRDYRYIAREESERVIAFKGRPHKITCGTWNTISDEKIGFLNLYDFSNLFQFTDWKDLESTSIEDVLKNCEVIDDDL